MPFNFPPPRFRQGFVGSSDVSMLQISRGGPVANQEDVTHRRKFFLNHLRNSAEQANHFVGFRRNSDEDPTGHFPPPAVQGIHGHDAAADFVGNKYAVRMVPGDSFHFPENFFFRLSRLQLLPDNPVQVINPDSGRRFPIQQREIRLVIENVAGKAGFPRICFYLERIRR